MNNKEKLDLMDKILRELDDLKNSQTAVLKKLSQVEADNINLGSSLLDDKLPDLHEEVDSSVNIVSSLYDDFQQERNKFYDDHNMGAAEDPTA